jgi:hypothetical protein
MKNLAGLTYWLRTMTDAETRDAWHFGGFGAVYPGRGPALAAMFEQTGPGRLPRRRFAGLIACNAARPWSRDEWTRTVAAVEDWPPAPDPVTTCSRTAWAGADPPPLQVADVSSVLTPPRGPCRLLRRDRQRDGPNRPTRKTRERRSCELRRPLFSRNQPGRLRSTGATLEAQPYQPCA